MDDFIFCLDENLCVKKERNEQHRHMLDPVEAVLCEKYYIRKYIRKVHILSHSATFHFHIFDHDKH